MCSYSACLSNTPHGRICYARYRVLVFLSEQALAYLHRMRSAISVQLSLRVQPLIDVLESAPNLLYIAFQWSPAGRNDPRAAQHSLNNMNYVSSRVLTNLQIHFMITIIKDHVIGLPEGGVASRVNRAIYYRPALPWSIPSWLICHSGKTFCSGANNHSLRSLKDVLRW